MGQCKKKKWTEWADEGKGIPRRDGDEQDDVNRPKEEQIRDDREKTRRTRENNTVIGTLLRVQVIWGGGKAKGVDG